MDVGPNWAADSLPSFSLLFNFTEKKQKNTKKEKRERMQRVDTNLGMGITLPDTQKKISSIQKIKVA